MDAASIVRVTTKPFLTTSPNFLAIFFVSLSLFSFPSFYHSYFSSVRGLRITLMMEAAGRLQTCLYERLWSHRAENYLNVNVLLGRSLEELDSKLLCELLSSFVADDPFVLHVAFVPYQDHLCVVPRVRFYLGHPAKCWTVPGVLIRCDFKPFSYAVVSFYSQLNRATARWRIRSL